MDPDDFDRCDHVSASDAASGLNELLDTVSSLVPALHRRRRQRFGVDGGNAHGGAVVDKYSSGFPASDTRVSSTAVSENEEVHHALNGNERAMGAS